MSITPQLVLKNLTVKCQEKAILHQLNLEFVAGSFTVILGPNGSGKSTLASFLAGHPDYSANSDSQVKFQNQNLLTMSPDQRSLAGMFLAFQQPVMIPGLRVLNFLWLIYKKRWPEVLERPIKNIIEFRNYLQTLALKLDLKPELIDRNLHEGFSGGEKKRLEMLQLLVLQPKLAILDEIDSGLDVDAIKLMSQAIFELRKNSKTTVILITHHQQVAAKLQPDRVIVLINGRVVADGAQDLLTEISQTGFKKFTAEV